jgi:hypothetical protein
LGCPLVSRGVLLKGKDAASREWVANENQKMNGHGRA